MNINDNKIQPIISVVIPAYRRPEYLRDLLNSFLKQKLDNIECIVVDDSADDTRVQLLAETYTKAHTNISYIKNNENLGFCKNLLKSITSATGKYILIMGDDDVLASADTLEQYVKVFEQNPEVGFVYSNQIQFNTDRKVDYIYRHFINDRLFNTTEESLREIWLLSCFISGIGLRNTIDFARLYPNENVLFPQVELIGKILGNNKAYGISKYLIGARAHDQQLGFAAVKNKNIKGTEKHSVYELNDIFSNVTSYYKEILNHEIAINNAFVNRFFEQKHMTIFPSEKINTNNATIIKIFQQAVKNNYKVLIDFRFMFYFIVSVITPAKILYKLKEWKKHKYISSFPNEVAAFNNFIKSL